jgi:epsin
LKAKERFARTASGFGSDGSIDGPSRDRDTPVWPESDRPTAGAGAVAGAAEIEFVRPQTIGEEELQLQLAIAMSKEEAEQEDQKRRSDDVRLQLALSQSEQDFKTKDKKPESHLVDLLDISFGAASVSSPPHVSDPWGLPSSSNPPQPQPRSNDIWSSKPADPWLPPPPSSSTSNGASAFTLDASGGAIARTISPSANSSTSIEGWLQNVPPMAGAVPVLPAKPMNNDLDGAWMKPPTADPWNSSKPQQVPDPWNAKSLEKTEPLDPWAPLAKNQSSGVSFTNRRYRNQICNVILFDSSSPLHQQLVKRTAHWAVSRQARTWMILTS